jgi:hypothetical protein
MGEGEHGILRVVVLRWAGGGPVVGREVGEWVRHVDENECRNGILGTWGPE